MALNRSLGDVPGITSLASDSAVLPTGSSVTEVNALGEVSADNSGIGDVSTWGDYAAQQAALDTPSDPSNPASGGGAPPVVNDPMQSSYLPSYNSDGTTSSSGGSYDTEQMANAQTIVDVGKKVGASDRDIQIALMAAIVESGLKNVNYGDRDSLGLFQQRDAWGSSTDRTTPAKAAEMFFLGGQGGQQGLLDIADRDKMPMGEAAQKVQVSAYPDRYAEHEGDAASLIADLTGGEGSAGDTSYVGPYSPKELMKRAEALANAGGSDPFYNSVSDDTWYRKCQHMVANLSGQPTSGYDTATSAWNAFTSSGAAHPASSKDGQEPPIGAWLYYAGSSAAGHTAVYLGNGKVASTDVFGNGKVGIGPMSDLTNGAWHETYLGWAAPWGVGKPQPTGAKTPSVEKDPVRQRIIKQAQTYLGTPFQWGGTDYTGVDSAGFVHSVYKHLGVAVPQTSFEQAFTGDPIPIDKLQAGDLIAWGQHPETNSSHVGIYLGNGTYIDAASPGRAVQLNELGTAALNAWGIPLESLIKRPGADSVEATPEPLARAGYTPGAPTGAPLQGQASSPYRDTAPSAPPKKHSAEQAGVGALNPAKPHAPMPGEY